MNNENDQEKRFSLDDFSKKSEEYYNQIKSDLESKFKGKYAALDFESKQYWIGETATEALTKAKDQFPGKVFYLVQVGSRAPFSIQVVSRHSTLRKLYDFARAY